MSSESMQNGQSPIFVQHNAYVSCEPMRVKWMHRESKHGPLFRSQRVKPLYDTPVALFHTQKAHKHRSCTTFFRSTASHNNFSSSKVFRENLVGIIVYFGDLSMEIISQRQSYDIFSLLSKSQRIFVPMKWDGATLFDTMGMVP